MNAVLLFLIAISASMVGAITGIGGGIIVKPVVDMLGLLSVESASFMSGCMVLSMALVSLCRRKTNGKTNDLKTLTPLAVGAAFGGIFGSFVLKKISRKCVSYIFQFLLIVIIFVCGLNMVWRL